MAKKGAIQPVAESRSAEVSELAPLTWPVYLSENFERPAEKLSLVPIPSSVDKSTVLALLDANWLTRLSRTEQSETATAIAGETTGTSAETHQQGLREEVEDLKIRNERLRSLVAQERRVAANEARRNQELMAELKAQGERIDRMVETLGEMAQANRLLQHTLNAKNDNRLRMFESFPGVVRDVTDDRVTVTYDLHGDYVDQTYVKEQFLGRKLPAKGEAVAIFVFVTERSVDRRSSEPEGSQPPEQRRHRKNAIRPPREF